ncbi:hypothetical protein O5290_26305 [Escherichia coli]|nr:hypothetical protein [Escherichia coli]
MVRIASKIQENLFLNRWRSTALKQHRFPAHIRALQSESGAKDIRSRLEYLWQACSGDVSVQTDLFRLTFAPKPSGSRAGAGGY